MPVSLVRKPPSGAGFGFPCTRWGLSDEKLPQTCKNRFNHDCKLLTGSSDYRNLVHEARKSAPNGGFLTSGLPEWTGAMGGGRNQFPLGKCPTFDPDIMLLDSRFASAQFQKIALYWHMCHNFAAVSTVTSNRVAGLKVNSRHSGKSRAMTETARALAAPRSFSQ